LAFHKKNLATALIFRKASKGAAQTNRPLTVKPLQMGDGIKRLRMQSENFGCKYVCSSELLNMRVAKLGEESIQIESR
jgi:hypothetical protein